MGSLARRPISPETADHSPGLRPIGIIQKLSTVDDGRSANKIVAHATFYLDENCCASKQEILMNDHQRQVVLDICNSFFRQDLHVHRMATSVLDVVESGTSYVRGAIILKGDENQPTRLFAHSRKGLHPHDFAADLRRVNELLASRLEAGVVKHTLNTGNIQVVNNVEEEARYVAADMRVKSELCLPLIERGEVFGAMNIESLKSSAFGRADVTLLSTVASQFGLFFRTVASARELACHHSILSFGDARAGVEGEADRSSE